MTNKEPHLFSLYRSNWTAEDALVLGETITESIHQDLDGWSDEEKVVINKYLEDIQVACTITAHERTSR